MVALVAEGSLSGAMQAEIEAPQPFTNASATKRCRGEEMQPAVKHGRLEAPTSHRRRPLSPISAPLDPELELELERDGVERFLSPLPE